MSQLTPDQLAKVEEWAAEGATLNLVQDRLKAEFGISLTYMEARLLLMEVGVKIKDKPREPEKPAEAPSPAPAVPPSPEAAADWEEDMIEPPETAPGGAAGSVTLTLDQIAVPGAMVSGKVTFSDGTSASWYLDQMGRLGLADVPPGYQPPKPDIPKFQQELERLLQKSGF